MTGTTNDTRADPGCCLTRVAPILLVEEVPVKYTCCVLARVHGYELQLQPRAPLSQPGRNQLLILVHGVQSEDMAEARAAHGAAAADARELHCAHAALGGKVCIGVLTTCTVELYTL